MSVPASILIYGRDLALLETRSWVLENRGYKTFITWELGSLKNKVAHQPIDLLLLCHSLSPEACEEALVVTEAIRPGMRRLLMTANTIVAISAASEKTISAFRGPKAMLAAVEALLTKEDRTT